MSKNIVFELKETIKKSNIAAMNRAAKTTLSRTNSFIREKYNFKKKELDDHISILSKARKDQPVVKVKITKPDISLRKFNATQIGIGGRSKKDGPRLKQGVKATVQKNKRILYRSKDKQRGSFIWKEGEKEIGVFIRTGEVRRMKKGKYKNKKREAIVKLFGVNLIQLFDSKSTNNVLISRMKKIFDEEYSKRLEHELKYRLDGKL